MFETRRRLLRIIGEQRDRMVEYRNHLHDLKRRHDRLLASQVACERKCGQLSGRVAEQAETIEELRQRFGLLQTALESLKEDRDRNYVPKRDFVRDGSGRFCQEK